ncbi:MAG: glycosyltransferase, partial [Terriglobales bacterium]
ARERAVVIGNGVALPPSVPTPRLRRQEREALGLPPAATVFTTVAMVHAAKGWRTWLAACTSIAAQRPGALFVWVGGGDELAALQRGVEASPARRQFLLPGTRNDVSRWLAASDIFLFPSHEEAQPTAVLEAMAAGLPIIATSVPSIAEVLGGCGRLVPVEDAPALAAAGLDWSGPGCAAAAAGATAARRRAEQTLGECSWRQRLLDLYEDVLAH